MKSPDPDYLTPAEVAARARVTRRTVYSWITTGVLDARRVGPRRLLIASDQLDKAGQPVGLNAYRETA